MTFHIPQGLVFLERELVIPHRRSRRQNPYLTKFNDRKSVPFVSLRIPGDLAEKFLGQEDKCYDWSRGNAPHDYIIRVRGTTAGLKRHLTHAGRSIAFCVTHMLNLAQMEEKRSYDCEFMLSEVEGQKVLYIQLPSNLMRKNNGSA